MRCGRSIFLTVILAAILLNGGVLAVAASSPQIYAGAGAYGSFLVDGAGALSAWGENSGGGLGIGSNSDQSNPTTVPFPSGVHGWRGVATANGIYGDWTYAIGDNGQLYGSGYLSLVSHHFRHARFSRLLLAGHR